MQEDPFHWEEIQRPTLWNLLAEIFNQYSPVHLVWRLLGSYFWVGMGVGFVFPLLTLWFHYHIEQQSIRKLLSHEPLYFLFFSVPLFVGLLSGVLELILDHLLKYMRTEFSRDYLTDLHDHRFFRVTLRKQIEVADRYDHSLSLLLLDLDHFKQVNDQHGHPTGDRTLRTTGEIIQASCRSSDIPCRYGGEEFAVILPNTRAEDAFTLAERIREEIEARKFEETFHLTTSGGVASYPHDGTTPGELIQVVDHRLYKAKAEGRNRIVCQTRGSQTT